MARGYLFKAALVFVGAALLLLAGCKDLNETVKNPWYVTTISFTIIVHIPGAGTVFPEVDSWYKDRVPTITPRPDLGEGWFALKWNQILAWGEEYHIGLSFAESQTIERGCTEWEAQGLPTQEECLASLAIQGTFPDNAFLVVSNPSDQRPVAVSALQWTATASPLPLANLYWGNGELEALNWQDVIHGTLFLAPGGSQAFPVPPSVPPDCYGLVRWKSGELAPYDAHQGVSQDVTYGSTQGVTYEPTPVQVTTWGRLKKLLRD